MLANRHQSEPLSETASDNERQRRGNMGSDADLVLARTVLLLVRAFAATNAFSIARLAGRPEREVARALDRLKRDGLATCADGLWSLTGHGVQACKLVYAVRPASVTRYHRPATGRKA
jgi:hypothetical protein